jgi:aryl-alcohol dehydrogenase-like predicted oxidoreductase
MSSMPPIDYRRLGASGLEVSSLCLGTMNFGSRTDAATAQRIIDSAYDAGINFVDTADTYAEGASERIVGAVVKARRRHWIVATKAGNVLTRRPYDGGLSRRWLLAACDDSLGRLGLDYIDVYYLHREDLHTPLAETVGTIGDLIRAGKIRYFGVSNFRGWRIAEIVNECAAQGVAPPVACQPYYNLMNRKPEVEVLPACERYGLGVAPYSPLARGVLTAKYRIGLSPPEDSRAAIKDPRFIETEFRTESLAIAATLAEHAQNTGRTLTQFALAWLWANNLVTSIVTGPRTLEQWQEYLSAIGTKWSLDDEALVDVSVRPGHPSTPGYTDPQYPPTGRPVDV